MSLPHLVRAGQDALGTMQEASDAPGNEVSLTNLLQLGDRLALDSGWVKAGVKHTALSSASIMVEPSQGSKCKSIEQCVLSKTNPAHTAAPQGTPVLKPQAEHCFEAGGLGGMQGSSFLLTTAPCIYSPEEGFFLGREGAALTSAKASAGFSAAPCLWWHLATRGALAAQSVGCLGRLQRGKGLGNAESPTRGCKTFIAAASHARPGSVLTQAVLFPKQRETSAFSHCRDPRSGEVLAGTLPSFRFLHIFIKALKVVWRQWLVFKPCH